MSAVKYIKAVTGVKGTVIYETTDGEKFIHAGGSRAWRNNNPGNLVRGKVSKRNGEIGLAAGFAVFPDYDHGQRALADSLKNVHGQKNLAARDDDGCCCDNFT